MIYNKTFTDTDLAFFLKKFDAGEVFFSFIQDEFEPQIVNVAKDIDPSLMVFAAMLPTISKENLIAGIEALMNEPEEVIALLSTNYTNFNFGRDDLYNDETLKAFIRKHPLSSLAFHMLGLGRFDEEFMVQTVEKYIGMIQNEGIHHGMVGLVRLSYNNSTTERFREKFFSSLELLGGGMESLIFNNSTIDEDEFMGFYELTPDHLKSEALANPACPAEIRDEFLNEGRWGDIEKLALASNLTEKQCDRYLELLMNALAEEPSDPEIRESFMKTLSNFVGNLSIPVRYLKEISQYGFIAVKRDIHAGILISLASRIHEDEELWNIAQSIMDSYNLAPHEAKDALRQIGGSQEFAFPTDLIINVNNILAFYYSLLRNVQTPTEILARITTQGSVASEALSLTALPHPKISDVQAAEILEKTVGSPFEQITLLHLRRPEVMKLVEGYYLDLRDESKLAIILNPKVDGETYLALALLEKDPYIKELLMRAGGDAHIHNKIGGLFLTPMSVNSKLEAWLGSGGESSGAKVSYAEFNLKA